MKVKFRTNLGDRDAKALGLDGAKCTEGSVVSVSESAAELVISQGIAEAVEKPKTVKAVAPKPAISKPETPETGKPEEKE